MEHRTEHGTIGRFAIVTAIALSATVGTAASAQTTDDCRSVAQQVEDAEEMWMALHDLEQAIRQEIAAARDHLSSDRGWLWLDSRYVASTYEFDTQGDSAGDPAADDGDGESTTTTAMQSFLLLLMPQSACPSEPAPVVIAVDAGILLFVFQVKNHIENLEQLLDDVTAQQQIVQFELQQLANEQTQLVQTMADLLALQHAMIRSVLDGISGGECPSDPDKSEPGVCGCGVPDVDTDQDGTPDCIDICPDHDDAVTPDCYI